MSCGSLKRVAAKTLLKQLANGGDQGRPKPVGIYFEAKRCHFGNLKGRAGVHRAARFSPTMKLGFQDLRCLDIMRTINRSSRNLQQFLEAFHLKQPDAAT